MTRKIAGSGTLATTSAGCLTITGASVAGPDWAPCVIAYGWPPIVSTAEREDAVVFGATLYVRVALPVPLDGVMVATDGVLLVAVHEHGRREEVVKLIEPIPPALSAVAPLPDSEKPHAWCSWTIVKGRPAMVSVVVRGPTRSTVDPEY